MIIVRKLVLGAFVLLFATAAVAQETVQQDDVLQRYTLATENLAAAVAALPDDPAASRASLDQAFSALLTLSRGGSGTLSGSIDRVFERARTAIENRSVTDLAVQVDVLRGGFQRLLYEAALTSAVEGRIDTARTRLVRLAQDVGLGSARIERLQSATDAGELRRVFEAGVAEGVAARLANLAQAGAPTDPDAAYRSFAEAYGDYLLVQDSPRLSADTNRTFVEAANALVDGDTETFLASVSTLRDELTALREAADAGLAQAAPPADTTVEPVPAEEDPAEGDPADQGAADEGAAEEDAENAVLPLQDGAEGPTDEEATDAAATEADATEGAGEGAQAAPAEEGAAAADETSLREQIAAEQEAERRDALVADLESIGVAEEERSALADALLAQGILSVDEAETELAALSDRLAAHVLRGEELAARARLREIVSTYEGTLAPIVVRVAPDADDSLRANLERLDEAPALRASDTALLASELQATSERLRGAAVAESHVWIDRTASWWDGLVRPVVMIVLALLAILPLRLLDLAFGGGNRNWRLVGAALFLLLLPVMYEGLAAAAALLAEPLALPVLTSLTTWSVFQNDLTQMVWAGLTLLALIFAAVGFYGICVQFGVLGRGRAAKPAPATNRTGDDTLVDWDDEF